MSTIILESTLDGWGYVPIASSISGLLRAGFGIGRAIHLFYLSKNGNDDIDYSFEYKQAAFHFVRGLFEIIPLISNLFFLIYDCVRDIHKPLKADQYENKSFPNLVNPGMHYTRTWALKDPDINFNAERWNIHSRVLCVIQKVNNRYLFFFPVKDQASLNFP